MESTLAPRRNKIISEWPTTVSEVRRAHRGALLLSFFLLRADVVSIAPHPSPHLDAGFASFARGAQPHAWRPHTRVCYCERALRRAEALAVAPEYACVVLC